MSNIFPEINKKIARLEEIGNDMDHWDEIEKLNQELADIDGFKKYELQLDILKYF
jgi:hypothetical protein